VSAIDDPVTASVERLEDLYYVLECGAHAELAITADLETASLCIANCQASLGADWRHTLRSLRSLLADPRLAPLLED
jgi:hypothetical protein